MYVSIIDIAKRSGVSKSTVSRVINGGPVSEKTRKVVVKTMKEMNYSPNYMARGLRGIKNYAVGILSTGSNIFLNPSYATRVAGIAETLQKNGYDLLFVHDDYTIENGIYTPKYVTHLQEKRIEGLITTASTEMEEIRKASELFRNVVYEGPRINPDQGFRVNLSNYEYSYDSYSFLLERGHNRILTVISKDIYSKMLFHYRAKAFKDATDRGEHNFDPNDFISANEKIEDHNKFYKTIYNRYITGKYSALFVDDLVTARMLISVFALGGLEIGKDYSILAVERVGKIEEEEAFITTVKVPNYEYGVRVAELIIEVIENEELRHKDVKIPYEIIIRNSVVTK